jgi:hypothetical protein
MQINNFILDEENDNDVLTQELINVDLNNLK